MYGSIHTHFESQYDTANNLKSMCQTFKALGCKKVAVTEHGTFSSFEDLRELASGIEDFEIIPGVEGYFGEEAAHIVLIAKNYKGYLSLCKIISESNRNYKNGKSIITLEHLKQYVSKGDVICTTACIAGVFGRLFGLSLFNLKERQIALTEELIQCDYENVKAQYDVYMKYKTLAEKPMKQRQRNAEKARGYGNKKAWEQYLAEVEEQNEAKQILQERDAEFSELVETMKALNRRQMSAKLRELYEIEEQLKKSQDCEKAYKKARTLYNKLVQIFGKNDFYFELQNHGLEQERAIYNELVSFAKFVEHDRFIASNDIHIGLTGEDKEALSQAVLKRNIIQFTRFKNYRPAGSDDYEYYIKTDEELKAELLKIFSDEALVDSAIANIEVALSDCHVEFPKNEKFYPKFCEDEEAEFDKQIQEGIKRRFPHGFPSKEYEERLAYEAGVIKKMGYVGYHLIVADYLTYGRLLGYLPDNAIDDAPLSIDGVQEVLVKRNITPIGYNIGPGRGSAVGSLVCYLLGITDIDPIPYNLLFERFLNVERASMPDIDSDFRCRIREKVIAYCVAKYGAECMCQIMTKSYGAIKGNLRTAGRYLGTKDFMEHELGNTKKSSINAALKKHLKFFGDTADKLCKMVRDDVIPDKKYSAVEEEMIRLAKLLDGAFMNYGQHAAGTIISSTDLTNVLPLMWNTDKKNMETQCNMSQAEEKGLLKMDFLALKNLDIITAIMRRVNDNLLQDVTRRHELLSEKEIYKKIFSSGLTHGVFQCESDGMKAMMRRFQPESFEDLILLIAAYRPGPLDYIPEIVAQKWFRKVNGNYEQYSAIIRELYPFSKKEYDEKKQKKLAYFYDKDGVVLPYIPHSISLKNEALEQILNTTYGCPIFQEQIMQIFQKMAGYSLGGADIVRRYMSKKKADKLEKERHAFIYGDEERGIAGCVKLHGITPEEADELFEQMMPFAKYGFNKSHATAYALLAFFTAYLKYHYPNVFFTESLNAIEELKELPPFVNEINHPLFGLTLTLPSIMDSCPDFCCDGNRIMFGLRFIKGMSELELNRTDDPEAFLYANPNIGIAAIKKYVQTGVFDSYISNRHQILAWLNDNHKKIETICDAKQELDTITEEDSELSKELKAKRMKLYQKIDTLEREVKKLSEYQGIEKNLIEYREWEKDLLGYVFSIEDSMRLIKNNGNKSTFELLETKSARINAAVISCQGPKMTKSGNEYYEVTLRDIAGTELVRRFDSPVSVLEGSFLLNSKEERFFLNKVKDIKPLSVRRFFLHPDVLTEDMINRLGTTDGDVIITVMGCEVITFVSSQEEIKSLQKRIPMQSGFYL